MHQLVICPARFSLWDHRDALFPDYIDLDLHRGTACPESVKLLASVR